jgi:hypothetical protein
MTPDTTSSSFIAFDIDGHVATLTLDRPERRNAFDMAMRGQMFDAIRSAVDNPQVRAIVLAGRGGHFCAGGDVKGMREIERLEASAGRLRMKDAQAGMRLLMQSDKPVIAAVEGCAYGGGFGLVRAIVLTGAGSQAFCAGADLQAASLHHRLFRAHGAASPGCCGWPGQHRAAGGPRQRRLLAGGMGLLAMCDLAVAAAPRRVRPAGGEGGRLPGAGADGAAAPDPAPPAGRAVPHRRSIDAPRRWSWAW